MLCGPWGPEVGYLTAGSTWWQSQGQVAVTTFQVLPNMASSCALPLFEIMRGILNATVRVKGEASSHALPRPVQTLPGLLMPLDNLWIMGQQRRGRKNLHDQNKQAPWRACQARIKFAGSRERLKIRGGGWAPIIPKLGGRGSRAGGAWPLTPTLIFTIRPPVFVQIDPTGSETHPIYDP